MELREGHYSSKFLDHLNWIIKNLEGSEGKKYYLEKDWFDEPTMVDIYLAKNIKEKVQLSLMLTHQEKAKR